MSQQGFAVFLLAICHKFTLCEYSTVRREVLIQLLAVGSSVTAKTGKFDPVDRLHFVVHYDPRLLSKQDLISKPFVK